MWCFAPNRLSCLASSVTIDVGVVGPDRIAPVVFLPSPEAKGLNPRQGFGGVPSVGHSSAMTTDDVAPRTISLDYQASDIREVRQFISTKISPGKSSRSRVVGCAGFVAIALLVLGSLIVDGFASWAGWITCCLLWLLGTTMNRQGARRNSEWIASGATVEVNIAADGVTTSSAGATSWLAWAAIVVHRTPHTLLLEGPHGHFTFIPERASESEAAHEALCALAAQRARVPEE